MLDFTSSGKSRCLMVTELDTNANGISEDARCLVKQCEKCQDDADTPDRAFMNVQGLRMHLMICTSHDNMAHDMHLCSHGFIYQAHMTHLLHVSAQRSVHCWRCLDF